MSQHSRSIQLALPQTSASEAEVGQTRYHEPHEHLLTDKRPLSNVADCASGCDELVALGSSVQTSTSSGVDDRRDDLLSGIGVELAHRREQTTLIGDRPIPHAWDDTAFRGGRLAPARPIRRSGDIAWAKAGRSSAKRGLPSGRKGIRDRREQDQPRVVVSTSPSRHRRSGPWDTSPEPMLVA